MLNVLIFHPDGARFGALVEQRIPHVQVERAISEQELRDRLPAADVLLAFRFPLDALDGAHRLRWIQVTSAGTEFLVPAIDRLSRIVVTNGRGIHAAPIADYAIAAAVMLHSDFPRFLRAQGAREWQRRPVQALAGRTLGIVGLGSIGLEIAHRGVAARMEVIGVRRSGAAVEGVGRVYAAAELHAFLPRCDFVVLTVPMTAETDALIGREELASMKRSAYLINVARGSVVDQAALTQALVDGTIAGACLDVFETEPLPAHSPLWTMPNVIVTPHIAGMRADYDEHLVAIFAENVQRFEAGQPLCNLVDLRRGY